jgi:hypothetical protein
MYRWIFRAKSLGMTCAGWFGLYIAAGGIPAFVIAPGQYTDMPGCYPHYSAFGIIESNCSLPLANMFWLFLVGIPRLVITPMVLVVALVVAFIKNFPDLHDLLNALPFVIFSAPFLFFYYVSFRYWRKNNMRIAILIPLLIAGETLFLGLQT